MSDCYRWTCTCFTCYELISYSTSLVFSTRYTADILEDTKKVLLDAGMNSVMPKPEPMHAFEEALRIMARRAGNEE